MVTVQVTFDIVVVVVSFCFAVVSALAAGLVEFDLVVVVAEDVLLEVVLPVDWIVVSASETLIVLSSVVKVLFETVDVDEISVLLSSVPQPINDKQSSIHMNNDIYFFIKKPPPEGQRYSRTFKILRFSTCPKAEFHFRQVSRLKI